MDIGLLIKKFATMNVEKLNVVDAQDKSARHDESDFNVEAKYLDQDGTFLSQRGMVNTLGTRGKGIKVINILSINTRIKLKRECV